jgi:hypothetical protein
METTSMTLDRIVATLTKPHGEESGKQEFVAAIEYHGRNAFAVQTRLVSDWTKKPWWVNERDKSRPVTECAQWYDVEWCRRDKQHYWHNSGGGGEPYVWHCNGAFVKPDPPPARIWLAPGVKAMEYVEGTRCEKMRPVSDAELLKKGYRRILRPVELTRLLPEWDRKQGKRTWNPFDVMEGDTECHWCEKCRDHLPDTDGGWLCDHLRWCDLCGWWAYDKPHRRQDDGEPVVHEEEEIEA